MPVLTLAMGNPGVFPGFVNVIVSSPWFGFFGFFFSCFVSLLMSLCFLPG